MALVKIDSLVRRDVSNKNKVDVFEVIQFAYKENFNIYCKFELGDVYSAADISRISHDDEFVRKISEPIKRGMISYLLVDKVNIDEILSYGSTQIKESSEGLEVDGKAIRRYRGLIRNLVLGSKNHISPTEDEVDSKIKEIGAEDGIYIFNKGESVAKGRIFQETINMERHWLEGAFINPKDLFEDGSTQKKKNHLADADVNKVDVYEIGYFPRNHYQYKFYIYRDGRGENNPSLFKPAMAPSSVYLSPDQLYIEIEDLKGSEYSIKGKASNDSMESESSKETKIDVTKDEVDDQVNKYLKDTLKIEKKIIEDRAIGFLIFLEVYVEAWLKTVEGGCPTAKIIEADLVGRKFKAGHARYMASLARLTIKDGSLGSEYFKKQHEPVPWKGTGLAVIEGGVKRLLKILDEKGGDRPERLKKHLVAETRNYLKETSLEERRYLPLIYKMSNIFRDGD